MSLRRGVWSGCAALAMVSLAGGVARGQDEAVSDTELGVEQFEAYLETLGLRDVLGAHLRERLKVSTGAVRVLVAERLGALYVAMLGDARTGEARAEVEGWAKELLTQVPESETFELRINLAKVSYLRAEEIAELDRLRLASSESKSEALRLLRDVAPTFADISRKVQARIDTLEKQLDSAADDVAKGLNAELATASRVRSLARYYAAWTSYYTALLGGEGDGGGSFDANKALENFGWILQAVPGKAPTVGLMPKSLLRYEHVGRAAIGTALTVALKGNDVEAIRWLDEIETAEDLNPAVRAQLFTRRLIVYAGASRWADAEGVIRRVRQPDMAKPAMALSPADARLAAVLGLEALRGVVGVRSPLQESAERVAQVGMGDLVARGEVSQVLDLVSKFGTAPIGDTGFIVQYVQGLQAYEKARGEQKAMAAASGGDADGPTTDSALINAYRQAAELLRLALAGKDAAKFESETARALMRRGFALFYAGDLELASAAFQESYEAGSRAGSAGGNEARRDALWYAIVSLDHGFENGKVSLAARRDALAVVYLKEFPDTEDAARLLLRQAQAELLGDEETLAILMGIGPEQPLYEAARRQAARVLYRVYRRAKPADKAFAAIRFADMAEEIVRLEMPRARGGKGEESKRAAQNVVLLSRQLADALLASPQPDVPRVEGALELMEAVTALQGIDLGSLGSELAYRRLQLAVAKGDAAETERWVLRLRQDGGEYALAGERLMYKKVVALWEQSRDDTTLAAQVVRHGRTILENATKGRDAASAAIRVKVAGAAASLWENTNDGAMRDLALALDKESVAAGGRTIEVLVRLGRMAEAAEDFKTALTSWQLVFAALPAGEPDWYEARYESLRLLWRLDQAGAVAAFGQFKALYPQMGPTPWREKFAELELEMKGFVVPPVSPVPAGTAKPVGAGGGA